MAITSAKPTAPSSLARPISRRDLWKAAIKPPMYTVAFTPISVGAMAAYADTQTFHWQAYLLFLTACVCIIAWLNLTNDVFDFDTGIDVHKRESVVNLCGATRAARNRILCLANLFLATAFFCFLVLSYQSTVDRPAEFDPTIITLMGVAVAMGYAYQGPPFRLGYFGLGEPICFFGWGLGVSAAYYAQLAARPDHHLILLDSLPRLTDRLRYILIDRLFARDCSLLSATLLVAYPTSIILFCSHFHQEDDDRKAGKQSPIVRLGTYRATRVLTFVLALFAILHLVLFAAGMLPLPALTLSSLSARHAWELNRFVSQNYSVPSVIRVAKYYAVKFHFLHGLWLSIGFFIAARNAINAATFPV